MIIKIGHKWYSRSGIVILNKEFLDIYPEIIQKEINGNIEYYIFNNIDKKQIDYDATVEEPARILTAELKNAYMNNTVMNTDHYETGGDYDY